MTFRFWIRQITGVPGFVGKRVVESFLGFANKVPDF
jgi:hypothetical protein